MIDIIFTARQLQEKCQEQNKDLYMMFVYLIKAFHTDSLVNHGQVWLPAQIQSDVWQFHDGKQEHGNVQNEGEFSEPFEVTNGVKQGFVMVPLLFSMTCSFIP